jgi:hypothetical protein
VSKRNYKLVLPFHQSSNKHFALKSFDLISCLDHTELLRVAPQLYDGWRDQGCLTVSFRSKTKKDNKQHAARDENADR